MWLPLGLPHAFRTAGKKRARFVGLVSPGAPALYDEAGRQAAERRLPGADSLSMEVEIPKWDHVGRASVER